MWIQCLTSIWFMFGVLNNLANDYCTIFGVSMRHANDIKCN